MNSFQPANHSDVIKNGEIHLRQIERKYGKDSRRYRERASALESQKKTYKKLGVICGAV